MNDVGRQEKGQEPIAEHPEGRWRLLVPDSFSNSYDIFGNAQAANSPTPMQLDRQCFLIGPESAIRVD